MKRTTYILLGIFASGLVLLVSGIIFISLMRNEGRDMNGIMLDGEEIYMDLEGVSCVKTFISLSEVNKSKFITASGGKMQITPSVTSGIGKISYPKNEYLNVSSKNDTLFIELDLKTYNFPEDNQDKYFLNAVFVKGLNLNLEIGSSLKTVISNMNQLDLDMKNLKMDSLLVRTYSQNVLLDSCEFRSFDIAGDRFSIHTKASKIENYYLNIDGVGNWTFENSVIGTEYLTASGRHSNHIQKGECRRVVWTPLSEDANLEVNLRQKATINIE